MAQTQSDERIREAIRGFDGVWRRVTGDTQTSSSSNSPADTLKRLIQDEQCSVTFSRCLARMLQGGARMALFSQANEACCRVRRLSAEYFILTGDKCIPDKSCSPTEGCLCSLRTAYERALETAGAYERAAECTDSDELRELYTRFAAANRCDARTLRRFIVNSF